jgi:leader peptidase (prepilin peptidase)/N-methyltransferase
MALSLVAYLALVGAAMGSFVDALVWRLHTGRGIVSDRSECESCHHKLGVADLIPVISWLLLRGRCRYCGAPVSPWSSVVEATLATLFVISFLQWPQDLGDARAVASFVLWLIYLVMLAALALYDVRWMRLPNVILLPLLPLALLDAGLRVSLRSSLTPGAYTGHVLLGVAALGGAYGVLYLISRGRWVGFGDVKLGAFAGAVLGWRAALLTLAMANVLGAAVAVTGLLTGRLGRKSRLPLGPFLIVGFVIAGLWGQSIIG